MRRQLKDLNPDSIEYAINRRARSMVGLSIKLLFGRIIGRLNILTYRIIITIIMPVYQV